MLYSTFFVLCTDEALLLSMENETYFLESFLKFWTNRIAHSHWKEKQPSQIAMNILCVIRYLARLSKLTIKMPFTCWPLTTSVGNYGNMV